MGYYSRSSQFLGNYLRSSLFLNGYTQSPNYPNAAGMVWLGLLEPDNDQPFNLDAEWTELSAGNYARLPVTMTYDSTNIREIYASSLAFPTCSGTNWGSTNRVGVYNAATSGSLLFISTLDDPDNPWTLLNTVTVNIGNTFTMPSGIITQPCNRNYDLYHGIGDFSGGVGREFAGYLTRWVYRHDDTLKKSGVDISREYKLRIGKYVGDYTSIMDEYGRLTDWMECSGQGYLPISLTYSDWEEGTSDSDIRLSKVLNKYDIPFTSYALSDWGVINMWVLSPINFPDLIAYWGYFTTPVNVLQGMSFGILANDLQIPLTV